MDVVWRLGECSTSEVVDAFLEQRPLAPTIIRTVLSKLRSKGYVQRNRSVYPWGAARFER